MDEHRPKHVRMSDCRANQLKKSTLLLSQHGTHRVMAVEWGLVLPNTNIRIRRFTYDNQFSHWFDTIRLIHTLICSWSRWSSNNFQITISCGGVNDRNIGLEIRFQLIISVDDVSCPWIWFEVLPSYVFASVIDVIGRTVHNHAVVYYNNCIGRLCKKFTLCI